MNEAKPIKLDPSKLVGFKQVKGVKEGKLTLAQAMVGGGKAGFTRTSPV